MEPVPTLHLPQTAFNQRANGSQREPELNKFWTDNNVFNKRSENNTGDRFTLHAGPPYAGSSASLHMGHVLNMTLKDVINKYHLMCGRKVTFVPGWDCHGLPTELEVVKKKRFDNPADMRTACASLASKNLDGQRDLCKRLGFMGRWDNPYSTMDPQYEAAELRVFADLYLKGLVYLANKPVHFSPSTQTVLAEAELEYMDRTDTATYVAFPTVVDNMSLVVWTTMPWTLLGNKAVCVNPDYTYARVQAGNDVYLVAADMVELLATKWNRELTVINTVVGSDLVGVNYTNPLTQETHKVLGDKFVTAATGTGLVHLCPAHGVDDFQVCQTNGVEAQLVANRKGKFDEELYPKYANLDVLNEGTKALLVDMEAMGMVVFSEAYKHSYPHDWRTKKPVLFLLTEQFFINVESFKQDALDAFKDVVVPDPVHRNRFVSMLSTRKDWCISRQRKWGLPLPVFFHNETREVLATKETLSFVADKVALYGSNVWFEADVVDLLPYELKHLASDYTKCMDTLDVWFDSGTSWAAVLQRESELDDVADLYVEGSDQHRGWFQSSLLTSVASRGKAPYKQLLTHGFVLDEKGRKMSKSEGNVVNPMEMLSKYNADVLRLWCMSVDYTGDVSVGENIMKQMVDSYFRLRNSFKFLLGNVFDYNPTEVDREKLSAKDLKMLDKLREYRLSMLVAYDKYNFREGYKLTMDFFTNMSKDYFDLDNKALLYESAANDTQRRNCQMVMNTLLHTLSTLLTPMVPYLTEDVHQNRLDKPTESVFDLEM